MAKRKQRVTNANPVPQELRNEGAFMVQNGLAEALGFNPQSQGVQLSQADTLFKNNRWYLISNMRQLLSEMYAEIGLAQTIVDVPVDDAFRGGIEIKSKELDEDDIQTLHTELEQENDITAAAQTEKWNRLYGGAATIIMTDQDAMTPLDISAIGENSILEFRAVDMWELYDNMQNTTEGQEGAMRLSTLDEFYTYYGQRIHKSRVLKRTGITAPSFIRPRLRGWGLSEYETLVRSINQYLKATDLTFEVLDEFKLDIYKIKGLTGTLASAKGTEAVRNRIALANYQKNYQNAITMDAEDDYVQKQLSFAGIDTAMAGIRMQVASDMRMPLTKLFGISTTGFSSGEDDIENYNAMIESRIRSKIKFNLLKIIELRCQKVFGFVPEDLSISFKPLRILSSEQEENVKSQKFTRLLSAKTAGEITSLEFREACNRDNLLSIQLETSKADLDGLDEAKEEAKTPPKEAAGKVSATAPKPAPEAKS